jgi:GNAT superfamily N-acetyltransferase
LSPIVEVTRTYLELRSPEQLRPPHAPGADVRFVRRDPCPVSHYRRLYHDVGHQWHWRDRLAWSDERLAAHLASANIVECVVGNDPAGFYELCRHEDGSVEIAYFGLVSAFIGRGYGGAMLTRAADDAWTAGAKRVWLHTCSLDSPRALPNYLARGFAQYHTEVYSVDLDDAG